MTPSRASGARGVGSRRPPRRLRHLGAAVLLVPGVALGPGGSFPPPAPSVTSADSVYHMTRPAMGTTAEVYLHAPDQARAAELAEAVFAEIERVEAALSGYRATSEVSRINRLAADEPVTTDPEVFGLVEAALAWSEQTGGAFDITVAPLVRAWGFFGGEGRVPTPDALAEARSRVGWTRVDLNGAARTVRFSTAGVELDFGGMGKGWALDSAARLLRGLGVESALLGLGGSSYLAVGAPPHAEGWRVSVPDPHEEAGVLSVAYLRDGALSTSGGTEKYFELDGRRHSHIIDPRTGRPSAGMRQVTVIAPTATDADVLSTALFVLGPEDARRMLAGEGAARADGPAALRAGQDDVQALLVSEREGENRVVRIRWSGAVDRGGVSRRLPREGLAWERPRTGGAGNRGER